MALRFDLSTEEILSIGKQIQERTQQVHDQIATLSPESVTFENTFLAIAIDDAESSTKGAEIHFLKYVSPDETVRKASTEISTILSRFDVEVSMRRDVYKNLVAFRDSKHPPLTASQQRFVEKTLLDYERNGLGLPDDKYDRLKQIKQETSDLSIQLQTNLNEDKTRLFFSAEQLQGLPPSFFLDREKNAEGLYVLTLKYPDLFPVMESAQIPETRKAMNEAYAKMLNEENTPLLEKILLLRREGSHLLGYPNHSSSVLETRMAKTQKNVIDFLSRLNARLEQRALKELEVLNQLKRQELEELHLSDVCDGVVHGYDFRYYHQMNLSKNYQIDKSKIQEYFPLGKVTKGLLEVYQELLNVKFQRIEGAPVWHPDVSFYAVFDADTSDLMGHFFIDLFPRDGKYSHAAAFPLYPRYIRSDNSVQTPIAAMVANFTKPTSSTPSLLTFDEVVTFFHEFGHIMHGMCTQAEFSRFSGTSVERDFVEAPSQMLENWCYESVVLERISGHYKDESQTLPPELLKAVIDAKNADTGLLNRRQIFFGMFDQTVHSSQDAQIDTRTIWHSLREQITLIPEVPGANPSSTFGHIVGGYDAQYYGYLYSEVFSADMYEKFKQTDVMSKELGKAYRNSILAPGGSRDSMEGLVEFLGRTPQEEAFLRHIGIEC